MSTAGALAQSDGGWNSGLIKRLGWRRIVVLVAGIVIVLGMVVDTKIVRIGSSEDMRQAAFSPETFGAQKFPSIAAAIEAKAADAATIAAAIAANKEAAVAKYGIPTGSGPIFSVKLTGQAGANPASGIYEIASPNLPPEIKIRVQTGPAINGTELRDATGMIQFGQFKNQIEFQNAGSALNNELKKKVLASIDTASLAGKTVTIVGAFRLINPKSWLITPARMEVK